MKQAAAGDLRGVLEYNGEPLVSDSHLNANGHRLAGALVLDHLRRHHGFVARGGMLWVKKTAGGARNPE